jgi:hypothetical protein
MLSTVASFVAVVAVFGKAPAPQQPHTTAPPGQTAAPLPPQAAHQAVPQAEEVLGPAEPASESPRPLEGREANAQAAPSDPQPDFELEIAPLLARRCLGCHNAGEHKGGLDLTSEEGLKAGGDSGAVLAERPLDSLLWQRVSGGEMPPQGALPASEQETLRRWLEAGAPFRGSIDPLRYTSDVRAGYDWWSLRPPADPALPEVQDASWIVNPIDAFVLARLDAAGLKPAPPADRRILIRRAYFDLLGLPPTPEEVAAFVSDPAPDAYERLIDRLLDSPHYGEHWARHWLDVVRFGESQGFERDKLRPNAWQYRDWVIWALNRDLPYDEFARLQIAGDVLAPHDPLAVIATGMLVAGPWDEVGQTQQSAAMRAVVRQDEMEDYVSLLGQAFLGLTVHCARCHDHKFDPVTQQDYYGLCAALSAVRHGERAAQSEAAGAAVAAELARLEAQAAPLRAELAALEAEARQEVLVQQRQTVPPEPLARWEFEAGLEDSVGGLHGTAHEGARVVEGRLVLDGRSYVTTAPLARDLTEKTLEAWVLLPDLDQRGGGVIGVQTPDGAVFDSLVFGEREPRRWLPGSNFFVRTQDVGGSDEDASPSHLIHVAIVYAADGTVTMYRQGRPYGRPYQAAQVARFVAGTAQVVFGLRHSPPGGNRLFTGQIERAALYDRALSPEEVAASAGLPREVTTDEIRGRLAPDAKQRWNDLRRQLSALEMQQRLLANGPVYAVVPKQVEPTYVLRRGDTRQPTAEVFPSGIRALGNAEFGLDAAATDAQRRGRLARWIASPDNPLFARVMANRVWHYHFGIGLVDTPNDFGFNGGRPTHPELLDWLALELIRGRWSLKHLHRTIMCSNTYRQSGALSPRALAADAQNRLLWRKTPLRLEAEEVRDAILAVSGELNSQLGGPGYKDFRTFTFNSQFYELIDPEGFEYQRRSIYRTWVRSGTNPLLDVLDCPDPSTMAPVRAVTTTPLQALALLNDGFVLRMSRAFAARLRAEVPHGTAAQIERAYLLAYGRPPAAEELQLAVPLVEQHGLHAFCRVLFNSNEFLYVD